jgi:hypothetical protein
MLGEMSVHFTVALVICARRTWLPYIHPKNHSKYIVCHVGGVMAGILHHMEEILIFLDLSLNNSQNYNTMLLG